MQVHLPAFWILVIVVAFPGCGENAKTVIPPEEGLALSLDIQSGCYSWPAGAFSVENAADLAAALPVGGSAVDFTLRESGGDSYRLATLLETKPVLLVLGAFT